MTDFFLQRHLFTRVTLFFCLLIAGCGSGGAVSDRSIDLLDRDLAPQRRLRAMQQLGPISQQPDPAAHVELLRALIQSDSQPDAMRNLAIDQLVAFDEAEFRAWIHGRILTINRWPVLEHLFAIAIEKQWGDFTRAAVRSYVRPSQLYQDADRPERKVIAALNPQKTVEQTVFDLFDSPQGQVTAAERVAAWVLLSRLESDLRKQLAGATSDALFVRELVASASLFDELPATAQSCSVLPLAISSDMRTRIHNHIDHWTPAQRNGLAIRHAGLLAQQQGDISIASLRADLSQQSHFERTERHEHGAAWSESPDHWNDKLVYADWLIIAQLLEAMRDHAVAASWFEQAEADLADETTELGGILLWDHQSPRAILVPPDLRVHDRQFVASAKLILRAYTDGIHYHFHAQSYRNANYAGPGPGDLAWADRYELAAVVLTFIDRDTLNVDYYQPGGVVIDLGCITR